jgi:hypothetical protein
MLSIALIALLAQAQAPAAAEPAKPPAEKPAVEKPFTLTTEIGYRWITGERGSINTYRSIVNLNEGPRALSFEAAAKDTKAFDLLRLTGANWGDPFNSAHLIVDKNSTYRATVQYRNMAYFNALPSFASPQLGRLDRDAYTVNQRSLDTRQRLFNADLDLRPAKRIRPFLGMGRHGGLGSGVSPIVLDENNYPVGTSLDWSYTDFRGGVHFELDRLHATLEQGGAKFRDDETLFQLERLTGNRDVPYLGRTLSLTNGRQSYGITGDNIYSTASLSASPLNWLDVNGQFFYARPRSDVSFNEANQGTLLWVDTVRFLSGQQSLATGFASQPRTSALFGAEVRPFSRLRIIESWQTDRTHNAASLALLTTLDTTRLPEQNLNDRLVWNQHDQRVQALLDVTSKLTLIGGHRYLWGDAQVRRAETAPGPPLEDGKLSRHSAIAGLVYRPTAKLRFNADTEVGRSSQTYFRTSLNDFEQMRFRGTYQISAALQVYGRFFRLANSNPTPGIALDFVSQFSGATVHWRQKHMTVVADYTRSTVHNDLMHVEPDTLELSHSLYRDNAHTGTLAADFHLPKNRAQLTLGGSLYRTAGSRPSRYYQPLMRLNVPLHERVTLFGEWRHYSLGQALFAFESFGSQQFTAGLRLNR